MTQALDVYLKLALPPARSAKFSAHKRALKQQRKVREAKAPSPFLRKKALLRARASKKIPPKRFALPMLREAQLCVSQRSFDNHQALWDHLQTCAPECGWLTQQSQNLLFTRAAEFKLVDGAGYVLEAELARGMTSWRVRGDGAGGWHVTELTEGKGDAVLSQTSTQLARDSHRILHRVYWRHSDEWGWRPWAARLTAVESKEDRA
jgi:hypothetical protein